MTDATFFRLVRLGSPRQLNLLAGNTKSPEPFLDKIKSIQLPMERLKNMTNGISDIIILTVAYLATIDVSLFWYINFEDFYNLLPLNSAC
jgi:hypothetical protein